MAGYFFHLPLKRCTSCFSMFDYKNYQPEQFAMDPSFRNWKLKGTREDSRFWTEWVAANPNKQRDIEKASLLLEAVESFDHINDSEVRHEVQRLAGQLDQLPDIATELPGGTPTHRWWQLRAYPMAAAVLIGLVGLGWWLLRGYASAPLSYELLVEATTVPLTEFVNTTASAHCLSLPDGSLVTLQPGSKVSYQADFTGDNREVYLSGEGFFEVTRDPQKPFMVYANQLVTKVLGTSFSVKANSAEDQVEVKVKTGRVAVYANTGAATGGDKNRLSSEVVLKPNQKLVYLWQQNLFSKGLVEDPQLVVAPEARPSFLFKGTPIDQVFEELEKAYGIEIVFDQETMQDCFLTASFTDEPLFEKLDLITRTLGAGYQQADGQIVITSRGCRP
jgi:transmembrane sensor